MPGSLPRCPALFSEGHVRRYAKLVQCDRRGQIVIPKEVRDALGIDESTGFHVYLIPDEGILLKRVEAPELANDPALQRLRQHAEALGISAEALERAVAEYKKGNGGIPDL